MSTYVEVEEPQEMGKGGEPPDGMTLEVDRSKQSILRDKKNWGIPWLEKQRAERLQKWEDEWEGERKKREGQMNEIGLALEEVKEGLDVILMEIRMGLRRRRTGGFESGNMRDEGKMENRK